jgi:hypothetical protein
MVDFNSSKIESCGLAVSDIYFPPEALRVRLVMSDDVGQWNVSSPPDRRIIIRRISLWALSRVWDTTE